MRVPRTVAWWSVACVAVGGLALPSWAGQPSAARRAVVATSGRAWVATQMLQAAVRLERAGVSRTELAAALGAAGVAAAPEALAAASTPGAWAASTVRAASPATSASPSAQEIAITLPGVRNDGLGDILDIRYLPDGKSAQKVGLVVRDGPSGRALWSQVSVFSQNQLVLPLPQRVGPAGVGGYVLAVFSFPRQSGGSFRVDLSAYRGSDGRLLWTRAMSGTVQSSSSGLNLSAVPELVGPFADQPGNVPDLLVDSLTGTENSNGQSWTVRTLVVSGRTGAVAVRGADVSSSSGFPEVLPVPSLGPGTLDDLVALTSGSSGELQARRGSDGSALWTNNSLTLQPGAFVNPVGPVTGPGTDLAVFSGIAPPPTVGPIGLPVAQPSPTVTLVSGRDGTAVWTHTGDLGYEVDRAGPSLVPAAGVLTFSGSDNGNTTTSSATVDAYDAAGNQLYQHTYTESVADDPNANFSASFAFGYSAGDLAGDGAQDLALVVGAQSGANSAVAQYIVDARDGDPLSTSASPLEASLTGRNDDLVNSAAAPAGLTISAIDGVTLRPLWQAGVPVSRGMTVQELGPFALLFRCSGLAASAVGRGNGILAVYASDGQLRWSILHSLNDATGGRLTLDKGHIPACG
ncbi:MAG: hypothetical protein ACYDB7_03675 [Mycobacteriales bacterium]